MPEVRTKAWQYLAAHRAIAAVPRTGEAFVRGDTLEMIAAAAFLDSVRSSAVEQASQLVRLLQHESHSVRLAAVVTLRNIGRSASRFAPDVKQLLNHTDPAVVAAATAVLGSIDNVDVAMVDRIAGQLESPRLEDRYYAFLAIGSLGEAGAKYSDRVRSALMSDSWEESLPGERGDFEDAALDALFQISPSAVVRLVAHPTNSEICSAAVEIMRKDPERSGRALVEAADVWHLNAQCVAEIVSWLPSSVVPAPLLQQATSELGEEDTGIRSIAEPQRFLMALQGPRTTRWGAVFSWTKRSPTASPELRSKLRLLLSDPNVDVQIAAARVLASLGEIPLEHVQRFGKLLGPAQQAWVSGGGDEDVAEWEPDTLTTRRRVIFELLAQAEPAARQTAPLLLEHTLVNLQRGSGMEGLRFPYEKPGEWPYGDFADAAPDALASAAPLDAPFVVRILNLTYDAPDRMKTHDSEGVSYESWREYSRELERRHIASVRLLAYLMSGGEPGLVALIRWTGRGQNSATVEARNMAVEPTLFALLRAWDAPGMRPELRRDLAATIAEVVRVGRNRAEAARVMQTAEARLSKAGFATEAMAVQNHSNQASSRVQFSSWFRRVALLLLVHLGLWIALIALYPRSRWLQASFFWNPYMRRFFGLFYVNLLLTRVPALRRRLFAPFQNALQADARLDGFAEQRYFADSDVRRENGEVIPILAALPQISGHVVLEGESGLGKTMFARYCIARSGRLIVYLPAQRCENGVLAAIQNKLHGPAADPSFLKQLLFAGALDICIDGLNEVTATTRAKILDFLDSAEGANILITTQPIEWTPPPRATVIRLLPLLSSKIEQFLLFQRPDTVLTADYATAVRVYLADALGTHRSEAERNALLLVLSNPMDLSVAASLLAQGIRPDPLRLYQQQCDSMTEDFQRVQGRPFPLAEISEYAFKMRLADDNRLPDAISPGVLWALELHRMVIRRDTQTLRGEPVRYWQFRHEKVSDYFIAITFMGASNPRPMEYLSDPRFHGTYLLLADLLPADEADSLRLALVERAADVNDHALSDEFIRRLRARRNSSEIIMRPEVASAERDVLSN